MLIEIAIALVVSVLTWYVIMVVAYYVKKIIEVNKIRSLITEIQDEYNIEIQKLFTLYEYGDIEMDELGQKEEFITKLYIKLFQDLEKKFVKTYNKERIRLK